MKYIKLYKNQPITIIKNMNTLNSKEKAKDLYSKFFRTTPQPYYTDKCETLMFNDWDSNWTNRMAMEQAIICVNEIMIAIGWDEIKPENKDNYWEEVKIEIIKIYKEKIKYS